MNKLFLRFT